MSATRALFRRDASGVFAANVLTTLVLFATGIVTARVLGPAGRGTYAVATLAGSIVFAFGNLGLPSATTYFVARGRYGDDVALKTAFLASLALGVAAAAIGGAVFATVGHPLVQVLSPTELGLSLLAVPFLFVFATMQAFILGKQRFRAYNFGTFAQAAVTLTLVALVLWISEPSAKGAIAAATASSIVIAVGFCIWCRQLVSDRRPLVSLPYLRDALRYGLLSHASNVLSFLGYRADVLLLAALSTTRQVGLYAVAVATAERIWIFSTVTSTVLFSRQSAESSDERRRRLTGQVARSVLLLTAVAGTILALVARPAVDLLYSSAFRGAAKPLVVILPGIVLFSVGRILANDIAARGRPGLNSVIAGVSSVLNVGLNVVLIPRSGALGAAWASTISYGTLLVLAFLIYRRLSGARLRQIIVPNREDAALWREIAMSTVSIGRGRLGFRSSGAG